ncbi:AEC family transporter [Chitinivorax sp. PXF-14]|uniref:AEC family transporter n=1 Tax=Chitinivorax sp. PXF-14 TaxID=3230488 RepID=UPI00346777A6
MNPTLILLPDFALILFGYGLRRSAQFDDAFWRGIEKFIYFVLFPPLLFRALVKAHLDFVASTPMLLAGLGFTAFGLMLGYIARPYLKLSPASFASGIQAAFRFNSYVGFAIIGTLDGQAGIAAIALLFGLMIPLVNIVSVSLLAHHAQGNILRELASNPLIGGIIVGLACNLAGIAPPYWVMHAIGALADAALPMGLISVGAGLRFSTWSRHPGVIAYWSGIKLVAVPACASLLVSWLDISAVYRDAALIMSTLPAATSCYILAVRMGGDGILAASLVTATTLGGMLSIPLWLAYWY